METCDGRQLNDSGEGNQAPKVAWGEEQGFLTDV